MFEESKGDMFPWVHFKVPSGGGSLVPFDLIDDEVPSAAHGTDE